MEKYGVDAVYISFHFENLEKIRELTDAPVYYLVQEIEDEDIELAKRKAADEMKNSISEMVIGIAEQVVEKEIDADAHSTLIDEAIDSLGDMYEK